MNRNPVLLYGELAVVSEYDDVPGATGIKIGDGTRSYAELPWFSDFSKVKLISIGQPNGVVPLDSYGRVPMKYLPERKKTDEVTDDRND